MSAPSQLRRSARGLIPIISALALIVAAGAEVRADPPTAGASVPPPIEPIDVDPVQTDVQAQPPSDPAPGDAAPSDAAPSDAAPSDAAPSDAAPSDAGIAEPEPSRPGRTPAIDHPEALRAFFTKLARTRGGEGITRITHFGDSSIGADGLPHALRRRFQSDAGDAGPGFVLLQPHSPSYTNRTVRLVVTRPWDFCFIIHRCRRDGHYGLGGVSTESLRGSLTTIQPTAGRTVTRAELWYAAQPNGGRIGLRFGGVEHEVDTRADVLEDRWELMTREPGRHELRVTALGGGRTRAWGVVLENEGPGVVWDTISMIGAFTHRVLAHDEAHFARQLAHRAPDLVVLNYGGNDLRRVAHDRVGESGLEEETHRLLARVRAGVPDASCLVVGISDHRRSGEADITPRQVEMLLRAQRNAAFRAGCAFWDTTLAMGGAGAFGRWAREGLASSDGKHLSEAGRRIIAARLHAAMLHAARAQGL